MKNTMLLFTLVLLLASCTVEGNNEDNIRGSIKGSNEGDTEVGRTVQLFDQRTFDAQRQLWQEQDLQDYSFYLRHGSLWGGVTVVVKNGVLDSFLFDGENRKKYEDQYYAGFLREIEFIAPVSDIYDVIMGQRNWLEAMFIQHYNDPAKYSSSVEVEYDDEYHFPKYIRYSCGYTTEVPMEGNWSSYTITITNFNPSPEPNVLSFDRETFDAQRQLWLEQDLPNNYTYHISYSFQVPLIEDWVFIEKGTVVIKEDRLSSYTPDGSPLPMVGLPRVNGTELWIAPFSAIYDQILHDTQKNPGLKWGRKSQTTLEVEYDGQYHFPNRYRFNAEPVEPGSVPKGLPYVYEFVITDFTITP